MLEMRQCDVCYLLEGDQKLKPCSFCGQCGKWICMSCRSSYLRRMFAAAVNWIDAKTGIKVIGAILFALLLASPARAQIALACPTGTQVLSAFTTSDNAGLIYQNACWNPTTHVTTFTNGSFPAAFPLLGPDGSTTTPTYSFSGGTNTGFYRGSSSCPNIDATGTDTIRFCANFTDLGSTGVLGWVASGVPEGGTRDTGFSRIGPGVVGLGNASQGDVTGSLQLQKNLTAGNCSALGTNASPSIVACGSASAGEFSCSHTASAALCVVNTTAVTAASEIFITINSGAGVRLGTTCAATPSGTAVDAYSAKATGTSFTVNVPTLVATDACFDYFIVN